MWARADRSPARHSLVSDKRRESEEIRACSRPRSASSSRIRPLSSSRRARSSDSPVGRHRQTGPRTLPGPARPRSPPGPAHPPAAPRGVPAARPRCRSSPLRSAPSCGPNGALGRLAHAQHRAGAARCAGAGERGPRGPSRIAALCRARGRPDPPAPGCSGLGSSPAGPLRLWVRGAGGSCQGRGRRGRS